MSVVTGIMLCTSCAERDAPFDTINTWLDSDGYSALHSVDDLCCNGKHPQMHMRGGGYNFFHNRAFVEFFKTVKWEYPYRVVLVLQPEDGPTEVYRPDWEPQLEF